MWFVAAAEPAIILQIIEKFPASRKADLWSGMGLAIGVWGLEDSKDMIKLLNGAKTFRPHLQTGIAFGAWSRMQSKEMVDYCEGAVNTICGAHVDDIVSSVDEQLLILVPFHREYDRFNQADSST